MNELGSCRVLVTGASSGIGASTALAFARAGASVALVGRDRDRLSAVLERCLDNAPGCWSRQTDLARPDEVQALCAAVDDVWGTPDVLVNAAAIPARRRADRLTIGEVERAMQVNYLAIVRLTLALFPGMLNRGSGTVIMVGSSGGRIATPGQAAYAGSKFALTGFTEALAIDLAGSGVQVRLVQPGATDTPMRRAPGNDEPLDDAPGMAADAVAAAVLAAAMSAGPWEQFVPADLSTVIADEARDSAASVDRRIAWARERYR